MQKIHETQGPQSKSFIVVSKRWTVTISVLIGLLLTVNVMLAVTVITNQEPIAKSKQMNAVYEERAKALGDLIHKRAQIQVFSYNKACAYARQQGEACLVNPEWWVDPKDYPLLRENPNMAEGLFGPQHTCCDEEGQNFYGKDR